MANKPTPTAFPVNTPKPIVPNPLSGVLNPGYSNPGAAAQGAQQNGPAVPLNTIVPVGSAPPAASMPVTPPVIAPSGPVGNLPLGSTFVVGTTGTTDAISTQPTGAAPAGALPPVTPPEQQGAGQGGAAPVPPALNPVGLNPSTSDPAPYQSTQTRTPSRQGS